MVTSLADLIRDSAEECPESIAIVDGDREITYAKLEHRVTSLARKFVKIGVEPGDRIGILAGNTYEAVVSLFAALRAGAVAVPIDPASDRSQIEHRIEVIRPRLLVTDRANSEWLEDLDTGGYRVLVTGSIRWNKWIRDSRSGALPQTVDPESTAVLVFTSGASGAPRAVMLSHRAILANIDALRHLGEPEAILRTDRSLVVLPLSHIYSLSTILTLSLSACATVVLSRATSARELREAIVEQNVTVVAGTPSLYADWSDQEAAQHAFAGVRLVLNGAAPLPVEVFHRFHEVTGKSIWEGYGLTECSPVVASTLVSRRPKAGCAGQPLPNVEVKLVPEREERPGVSIDGLDEANEREPGEIWVRGPSLFSGYWPDGSGGPDEQGWFGTGDVGYVDADGDLSIIDRRTEMLVVSGFRVYPREVASVITRHPEVAECAVFGIPHDQGGESVKAVVALVPGGQVTAAEVTAFCEQNLARFKCPSEVEFMASLPRTASGRIDKDQLRRT